MVSKVVDGNIGSGRHIDGPIDEQFNNEPIVLAATAINLPAGTVLGRVTQGAQNVTVNAAADDNNVGNGVFAAAPTADANVAAGDYDILLIEGAANAGRFEVRRPGGAVDGQGQVGVAYNGSINFTLNDGATDFVAGDRFRVGVTYTAGSGQFKAWDPAAVDGSQNFAAFLWHAAPILGATQRNVGTVRGPVRINGNLITYAVAATSDQKKAVEAQAAALGIIIRR